MKYCLYQKNNRYVFASISDKNKISVENDDALYDVVNYFKYTGFQIIITGENGKDLLLKTSNGVVLRLYDYDPLLERKDLSFLRKIVDDTYNRQGAVDHSSTSNISRKHTHNSKHAGKFVKKVGIVVLSGALLFGAYTGVTKAIDEHHQMEFATELQQPEQPMHIMDIGDTEDTSIDDTIIDEGESNFAAEEPTEFVNLNNEAVLNYEHLYNTNKAINCKTNYYDLIKAKAPLYGLDSEMMLGIATQERGTHSRTVDEGGAVGLFQLQYSVWAGETISYYKLDENGVFQRHTITVTDEMLRDLDTNIDLACIAMQQCLGYTSYNIPMAIQMYNQGYGSIHDLLIKYCEENNLDRGELCRTPSDLGWYSKTGDYAGDPEYLEHVLQWCEDTDFSVVNIDNGENVEFHFSNNENVRN